MPQYPSTMPAPHCPIPSTTAALLLGLISSPSLAQLERLQPPPSLPSLAEPPVLQHALFENPVPPVILAFALSLAAYAIASRLDRRRVGVFVAGVGLVLGVAVIAISGLVQTDRERVQARTRTLVAAIAEADAVSLDQLLAADARMFVTGSSQGWTKRAILDWVDDNLSVGSAYEVKTHRVGEVQAQIGPSGKTARSRATVSITPLNGSPTRFICMMTWQQTAPDTWSVVEIDPLWLQGLGEVSNRTLLDAARW